ncbi:MULTISPECIES: aminotransferase class IV family protein [unclassified Shinella]|uniref:aminotransferase class IV family protein n=1 Tax=unclassified Shinella TaxID=2643062 RepID=UPI00225D01A3|nr:MULTISPECIES: aminotransferase class IV family protein [unclassified Shinella]MCO5141416.1 aminotransferase class IV family protein [Shinella sp.]CAI0339242.1 Aminodeoxychorismate lyase [Rhizobiaceae bacterium]CAK7257654.1 putative branched-chain-amino-acid aminotransferase [Shinella sp. WSC3-e]
MDISLIETLRWEPAAGFVRLERHLARLARSAAALGLAGSEGAEQALFAALPPSALPGISPARGEIGWSGVSPTASAASEQGSAPPPISPLAGEMPGRAEGGSPQGTPLRIRLELFPDGRIDIQTAPFTPLAPDARWRLKIAATRLASADPLLRHKTSRRSVYTAARAEVPATEAEEVILLNERGELCEGTITSLFLDDGTGILKTPPLASGLLAGVLRDELLETGKAVEEILRPKDLAEGTAFVGNSLRGLIWGELT